MSEVSYDMVMDVTMSWDKLKRIPNYQDVAGEMLALKVFELEPKTKAVFKMEPDEDARKNSGFSRHSRIMLDMIDCSVGFLGPDLDFLSDDLKEIGKRHKHYGITPEFLPVMEKAVFHTLETLLGDSKFTEQDKKAWAVVFKFLTSKMVLGMTDS